MHVVGGGNVVDWFSRGDLESAFCGSLIVPSRSVDPEIHHTLVAIFSGLLRVVDENDENASSK